MDRDFRPFGGFKQSPHSLGRGEAIADPWLGEDQSRGGCVISQLFAQVAHGDAQIMAVAQMRGSPDGSQQFLMGQKAACVARQQRQHVEFLSGQVHGAFGLCYRPGGQVDAEVADSQDGRRLGCAAAADEVGVEGVVVEMLDGVDDLRGVIVDEADRPVAKAKVTLRNTSSSRTGSRT